jgi:hypothetical protein
MRSMLNTQARRNWRRGRTLAKPQFGDRILAPQPGQNHPDLVFGRILLARRATNVPHMFLGRLSRPEILSHVRSLKGGDEPESLR